MKRTDKCIICGNEDMRPSVAYFSPFVAHRCNIASPTDLNLHYCPKCDFHFFNYRYDESEIARLYFGYREEKYNAERLHFEPYYQTLETQFRDRNNPFHRNRIEAARSFFAPIQKSFTKVLDYGGEIDGWMAKAVFPESQVLSYDISVEGIQPTPASYNVVMCCAVLEHASDPIPFLDEVGRFLAPDGLLYIEVPLEPAASLMHEHLSFFTPRSVVRAMHWAGFNTLSLKTSSPGSGTSIGVLAKRATWRPWPRLKEALRIGGLPALHRWSLPGEATGHPLITPTVVQKINERADKWIESKARVVMAPASNFNIQLLAATKLKDVSVVALCDKSPALQGKSIGGIPVCSYERIDELKPSVIFVSSPLWEEDIFKAVQFYQDQGIEVIRSSDVIR